MSDVEGYVVEESAVKPTRRSRTCFSKRQLEELESLYKRNPYPDSTVRQRLVRNLKIKDNVILIWFKNRRAKQRKADKSLPLEMQQSNYQMTPQMAPLSVISNGPPNSYYGYRGNQTSFYHGPPGSFDSMMCVNNVYPYGQGPENGQVRGGYGVYRSNNGAPYMFCNNNQTDPSYFAEAYRQPYSVVSAPSAAASQQETFSNIIEVNENENLS